MNILIGVLILAVPNCCPMLFRPQIKHAGPKPWMAIPLTLSKFQLKTRKKKTRNTENNLPPNFLPWFPPHLLRLSWSPGSNGEDVRSRIGAAEAKGTHTRIAYKADSNSKRRGDEKFPDPPSWQKNQAKTKKNAPGWAHQVLNKPNLGKMASCLPHS